MLAKSTFLSRSFIGLAVPIVMFLGLIALTKVSLSPPDSNALSFGITIDLLITVPLIYFLIIRKTAIPKITVVPILLLGFLIGTYFLPRSSQMYLDIFQKWALPVIEISVLAFIVIKVRSAIKKYKAIEGKSGDFFSALKSTCQDILPNGLVGLFATEIAVMYYGFIHWKKRTTQANEFTYHEKSGTRTLLIAFLFIIPAETFVVHLLLAQWSTVIAWVLTGLSLYAMIQVLGFMKSLSRRPMAIGKNSLILRYGILAETEIPFTAIERFELTNKPLITDGLSRNLSPLWQVEGSNVIIFLIKENLLFGLYGIKKSFNVLALHVDEPVEFKLKIDSLIA